MKTGQNIQICTQYYQLEHCFPSSLTSPTAFTTSYVLCNGLKIVVTLKRKPSAMWLYFDEPLNALTRNISSCEHSKIKFIFTRGHVWCNGNRTEWSPIRSVIIWVNKIGRPRSGSPICSSRVLLQTELDDTKSYYQLIIKITIFEKRIAKLRKSGKINSHQNTCKEMKNLLAVIRRQKHKSKRAHARTYVITTLNVIGWFKLQLWMCLAYWTVR